MNQPLSEDELALISYYRQIRKKTGFGTGFSRFEVVIVDGRWDTIQGGPTFKRKDIPQLIDLLTNPV